MVERETVFPCFSLEKLCDNNMQPWGGGGLGYGSVQSQPQAKWRNNILCGILSKK